MSTEKFFCWCGGFRLLEGSQSLWDHEAQVELPAPPDFKDRRGRLQRCSDFSEWGAPEGIPLPEFSDWDTAEIVAVCEDVVVMQMHCNHHDSAQKLLALKKGWKSWRGSTLPTPNSAGGLGWPSVCGVTPEGVTYTQVVSHRDYHRRLLDKEVEGIVRWEAFHEATQ